MRAVNQDRGTELATAVARAATFWSRLQGLRGRSRFENGQGLWIVPCRGVHTSGLAFDIDVLFLDADRRVVAAEERMKPGRMSRIFWRARSVLELPAGTVRRSETRVGDQIQFVVAEAV